MSNSESLQSHLEELIRKHSELHDEIENFTIITDEVRRLKTKKLWLKDEIYRVRKLLDSSENTNGTR